MGLPRPLPRKGGREQRLDVRIVLLSFAVNLLGKRRVRQFLLAKG